MICYSAISPKRHMKIISKIFFLFFLFGSILPVVYAEEVSHVSATVQEVDGQVLPQEISVVLENESLPIRISNDRAILQTGDKVYIQKIKGDEGTSYSLFEINKLSTLLILFAVFIFTVLLINGVRGIRALLSLIITTLLTLFGLLPLITAGYSPIITTIVFAAFILAIALFVTHGFSRGSLLAYISSVLAVICAGIISSVVFSFFNLSSVPTDELAYLTSFGFSFEIVGAILFAGIIVGTLGVVDDVAITQIAIVQELRHTNPNLDLGTLFQKAFRVGREHVGALVNTLAFAYIGASLPLFVLLSLAPEGILIALQKEPVIVEIIRIFSGSIGVLLVVPIATALAVFYKNNITIKNTHPHSHI